MRFFVRNGKIHVEWWNPDKRANDRESTGLPAVPGWEKRYKKQLAQKQHEIEAKKHALKYGLIHRPKRYVPVEQLLILYNEANREERGTKSPKTLLHRKHAVDFALRFRPNLTTADLTRRFFLDLRLWAEQDYSPSSVRGYFTEWRMLCDFAVRSRLIEDNPVKGIAVKVALEEPESTDPIDEQRLFTWLYKHDRRAFDQALFLRLTGARVSVSERITTAHVDLTNRRWRHVNTKGHRTAWMPMQPALHWLLSRIAPEGPYLFHYRAQKGLYRRLQLACEALGIERVNPHQLKANYVSELDSTGLSDRLLTLAAHHAPQGETSVIGRHYSRNRDPLLIALESAQRHWLEFLERLESEG